MASAILNTYDVYDFSRLPNPLRVGDQPCTPPEYYASHYHPQVGLLEYNNISLPHMHVMDLRWKTNEAVKMINDVPIDTVNFNFQLTGLNEIRYSGLDYNLDTRKGEHYLIYHPEGDYYNSVKSNTYLEVFHISLDRKFFASSIGADDAWSENIQKSLDLKRAFSGIDRTLKITFAMWNLIREIQAIKSPGPMRSLLIQSKALELVALQLDQLKEPQVKSYDIRKDDAEKLHQLKIYLDANFLSDLSLSQLSREFLLNEFKLKKGFKMLFGSSVFNYLRKIRMEYAVNLLRDHALSVDEVADILGYEYSQHFSAAFKNFIGVSPSSFHESKKRYQTNA